MDTKGRHLLVNSILSLRRLRLVFIWYPNISRVESRSNKVEKAQVAKAVKRLLLCDISKVLKTLLGT
jgi:hypothetical protein